MLNYSTEEQGSSKNAYSYANLNNPFTNSLDTHLFCARKRAVSDVVGSLVGNSSPKLLVNHKKSGSISASSVSLV